MWEKLIYEKILKKSIIEIEVERLLCIPANSIKDFHHYDLTLNILKNFYNNFINNNPKKIVIDAPTGYGKTTLSIYIVITLLGLIDNNILLTFSNKPTFNDNILEVLRIYRNHLEYNYMLENGKKVKKINFDNRKNITILNNMKIAFICPYRTLKTQLVDVFNKFDFLINKMQIFTTSEYIEKIQKNKVKFDLLFIDNIHSFNNQNRIINIENQSLTEFEFILQSSNFQIIFYDLYQSLVGNVTKNDFLKHEIIEFSLRND